MATRGAVERGRMIDPIKLRLLADGLPRRKAAQMQPIAPIFERLNLVVYTERFVENGFEAWEDVLDITEDDLDTMQVLRGHRRRLQREIADSKGIPIDQVIHSPGRATSLEASAAGESGTGTSRTDTPATGTGSGTGKRRYRRHPKPDPNAPERPPSAYVLFSNEVREELKAQNLSFTEMAKVVGERWQQLDTEGREPYESKAGGMKEEYNTKLSEYKRTDDYKEYAEYLVNFKATQANASNQNQGNEVTRPKLETSGDGSHGSSRGSQGTPTTSAHGSPIAVSAGLMHLGITDGALASPISASSYQTSYQPGLSGRSTANSAARPPAIVQGPKEQQGAYTAHQPLPPISTDFAQRGVSRRSDRLPPSFLGRSTDPSSSTGGSQSSGMYSPVTPADPNSRSTGTPLGDSGTSYSQHHGLKHLSLSAYDRPSSASTASSHGQGPAPSPIHPPYGGPEAASRTLPPLHQPGTMSQQQQSRMDGLSVLALAGRLIDGDRERLPETRPKPP